MSSPLLWLRVALFSLAVLSPAVAHAQVVQLPITVERSEGTRPSGYNPNAISYTDCVNGDVMTFEIIVDNNALQYNLEVWAGTVNCVDKDQRQATNMGCWQVFSERNESRQMTVPIRTQAIAARQYGASDDPSTAGGPESCENSAPEAINLYFMIVSPSGDVQGTHDIWETALATDLPTAPSGLTAAPADGAISLEWTASTTTGRTGYNFYCEVANSGGTADGGIGACGGQLIEGEVPPATAVLCGTASSTATRGTASMGIMNGQSYGVAVATTDSVLDVGRMSNVVCVTPEVTYDFFDRYRESGGRGGGGICALSQGAARAGGFGAWVAALFVAGLALGRHRRSSR